MRELTVREREAVGGGLVPTLAGAAIGAASAGAGYLGGSSTGSGFNWKGFGKAVLVGAIGGAISGPAGAIRAYFMPRAAFGVGAVLGH